MIVPTSVSQSVHCAQCSSQLHFCSRSLFDFFFKCLLQMTNSFDFWLWIITIYAQALLVKLMWEFFVLLSLLSRKAKFTNADWGEESCCIVRCVSLFFHFICFSCLHFNLSVHLLSAWPAPELPWHDSLPELYFEHFPRRKKSLVVGISAPITLLASATSFWEQPERKQLITIFKSTGQCQIFPSLFI